MTRAPIGWAEARATINELSIMTELIPTESTPQPPKGWVGVDLDGTLAHYEGWNDGAIGDPILCTLEKVRWLVERGWDIRIVTARAAKKSATPGVIPELDSDAVAKIQDWCEKHVGKRLPVQFWKDFQMIELWDDRALQFIPNTGIPLFQQAARVANTAERIYRFVKSEKTLPPAAAWEELRQALGLPEEAPESVIVRASHIPGVPKKLLAAR